MKPILERQPALVALEDLVQRLWGETRKRGA